MFGNYVNKYLHKPDVNNNKSQDITTRQPLDKFTDDLAEGIESSLPHSNLNLNIGLASEQEYECLQLPPIELRRFGSNPSERPEFISNSEIG